MTDLDYRAVGGHVLEHFRAQAVRNDPVQWAERRGLYLWSAQRTLLQATVTERSIAAPAGHGVGKSTTAAILMAFAGDTATDGDTKIVTTAPTAPQLENIWGPFRLLHRKLELPGKVSQGMVPTWTIDGLQVAIGRTTKDTDPHSLSGQHAERLYVIADEADGIAPDIFEQLRGMVTGDHNRLITLGNPRNPRSKWRELTRTGGWFVLPISVLDSPAFTGEDAPPEILRVLPGQAWVDDQASTYGRNSAFWKARVLGEWPDEAEESVIKLAAVRGARRAKDGRPGDEHQAGDDAPTYACDVARGGDRTVIGRIVHRQFTIVDAYVNGDTTTTRDKLEALLDDHPGARVVVDGDGIGGPLVDMLNADGYSSRIIEYRATKGQPRDPDRYRNVRAESWWTAGKMLEQGRVLLDPHDPHAAALEEEATSPQIAEDPTGRLLVERKADVKRRLGRSPDLADTFVMACFGRAGSGRGHVAPRAGRVRGGLLGSDTEQQAFRSYLQGSTSSDSALSRGGLPFDYGPYRPARRGGRPD